VLQCVGSMTLAPSCGGGDYMAQAQPNLSIVGGYRHDGDVQLEADRKREYTFRSSSVDTYAAGLGFSAPARAILRGILAWQFRRRLPHHVVQYHPLSRLSLWAQRSAGSVRRYRAALVEAGMLRYVPGAKGRAAGYMVYIPAPVAASPADNRTLVTPLSKGYRHLSTRPACTHMARSEASGVCTDPEGTDRTISAQVSASGGQFYGVEGRLPVYVDLHHHAAEVASLRWEGGLFQQLVQAIDDALRDGRDVEWIRQAIDVSYATRYAAPQSICWFVPAIYGAMRDGIVDAADSEARKNRGKFGAAWKAVQGRMIDGGAPTIAAIVSQMVDAGIYDWFLSEEAEPLIMRFSDQASPNPGVAQDNARALRKELVRLRTRAAQGVEPPTVRPRLSQEDLVVVAPRARVREAVADTDRAVVGDQVRKLVAQPSVDTTEEDDVAERERLRDAARRAFRLEAASEIQAHAVASPDGPTLDRDEFERELAAAKEARAAGPKRFAQDDSEGQTDVDARASRARADGGGRVGDSDQAPHVASEACDTVARDNVSRTPTPVGAGTSGLVMPRAGWTRPPSTHQRQAARADHRSGRAQ
jgi:hypothetical protein